MQLCKVFLEDIEAVCVGVGVGVSHPLASHFTQICPYIVIFMV